MMRRLVRRFGNAFTAMPLVVKVALLWLIFILAAAIYSRLDRLFGQALPLKTLLSTFFRRSMPVEGPSSSHCGYRRALATILLASYTVAGCH